MLDVYIADILLIDIHFVWIKFIGNNKIVVFFVEKKGSYL